ncbi:hypothetical protein KC343_g4164 [Hortaea werneckii]|nr:hypothetical protein KC352_g25203 [Hortaea werneckii]KAI7565996.1 hypothetical protein KC317_g5971 [Hortaea werneckii]KAI7603149.1 hypothetical protein KC346_g12022 [Hortaea werneckii]KAI7631215.1 hypothetical protein KC343_g4164 [Hortaea werneckii]KAI7666540.1 hypothetical protein KC319_g6905 [Hortaea werneckii]
MIPAIQNLINYLNPTNANRIANLSPYDPFVVLGFILLALIVPISLLLLTVVARRSVYSIMDRIQHEGIYRRLRRRKSKRLQRMSSLLPTQRFEEVAGNGSGRVVLGGEDAVGKQGGREGTGVASKQSMPEQQDGQVPPLSDTTQTPPTPLKKEERRTTGFEIPNPTTPAKELPLEPIQRPLLPSETLWTKTAVVEPSPPVASQSDPAKPSPSKPTQRPPAFATSPLISAESAVEEKRPPPDSKTARARRSRSPIEPTFEELYDKWEAAQRAPRIDLAVEEDPRARREWFVELQVELRGAGLRAKLGG